MSGRARTPPAAGCWGLRTAALSRATRRVSAIVHGASIDPDDAIAELDRVTFGQVRDVAAAVSEDLAVSCVGPHDATDF